MIPFFIFFATGVSAALLTWFWGGNGTASPGEQELGMAGSLILVLSAYVSAFSLWAGRCIAALALLLIGIYCLCENVGIAPRVLNFWVLLALLLLIAAGVYVVGSFRITGVESIYYPRHASPTGKMVVGAFIAAPIVAFAWWALWHDASRELAVTVPARWEPVTLQRVTSGRHQVKFTALDSSLSVTVASDALYDELQSAQKQSVDVLIKETFKHGTMVSWRVDSIDGSYDFPLLEQQPEELKQ